MTVADTDKLLLTTTVVESLTISNRASTANAAGPYLLAAGFGTITLEASATDPGADAITYEWSFDKGVSYYRTGQAMTLSWNELVTLNPAFGGPVVGSSVSFGVIRVGVNDETETTVSAATNLAVNNTAPVAIACGPYAINEGSSLTVDAGSSTDVEGAYAVLRLGHRWRWSIR